MIQKFDLKEDNIGFIPSPHDCIIKKVELTKDSLVFYFEDDISAYDSIQNLNPKAKSLIIRYHLIDDLKTYEYKLKGLFNKEGYLLVNNDKLKEYANEHLEYLYTYRGYNSLILILWYKSNIMLDICCDNVEYEWIE